MRPSQHLTIILHSVVTVSIASVLFAADAVQVTEHCFVEYGAVNAVVIRVNDQQLAVYGWDHDAVDRLLLTHGRRDVLWRAKAAARTAAVVAPTREKYGLQEGPGFWARFPESRFHDYAQQSTKIPNQSIPVQKWVAEGDTLRWNGLTFQVIETPGFTRGSASYVVEVDGKRIGFCGDLIFNGGKILDLYSFQDAIPDAQIRGYHGYGARLAELVSSLDKIIEAKLDMIVPSRGPLISNPTDAAQTLQRRVQFVYRNYLSTNALHWYFKEDRMRMCGERVLGKGAAMELMPYAKYQTTPDWIFENSTSRLLISEAGKGFLIDCGYQRVIDSVQQLIDQDVIERVDGIFVTHFHDDHTDMVQAAAEQFGCPVYATPEYADVLERPADYHLPAMTKNPIHDIQRMKSGRSMKWNEFNFTFHFFPGQTWYHGALFVEKPNERPVFFVGDAFAPSGFDDYCLLNRNLLHDDEGYLLCLKKIREAGDCWLVNEHIAHVFAFSNDELSYLEKQYRARRIVLSQLFPWDDPNYGVDEQWAVLHPRASNAKRGDLLNLELRITNHSPIARTFTVTPRFPDGLKLILRDDDLRIQPRKSGTVKMKVKVDDAAGSSLLVTADIISEDMQFGRWADAHITIAP